MSHAASEGAAVLNSDALQPTESSMHCVLVVVVLFNKRFEDVPCAQKITQWLNPQGRGAGLKLAHCLVYDNSPVSGRSTLLAHDRMDYVHDASNGGTRAAYLKALDTALAHSLPWILFLDHDTDLPVDFFQAADQAFAQASPSAGPSAVLPQVFDGDVQVSPSSITRYGRVQAYSSAPASTGASLPVTAIASASLVRTSALAALLPIPAVFQLDYLDHWLFREIQYQGGCLAMSGARVEHSLSVASMRSMSVARYRAILSAERAFLRGGRSYSRTLHGLWGFLRMLKIAVQTRRRDLVGVALHALIAIVCSP